MFKHVSFNGAVVCVLFEELFMTPTENNIGNTFDKFLDVLTSQTHFTSGILKTRFFLLGCNLHFSRGVLANFLSVRNKAMKL